MRIAVILISAYMLTACPAAEKTELWQPMQWNGERALVSSVPGWKAIVSLERGRLVHFGPADSETNLLFEAATRTDPAGWGGHRLWLGPQHTWSNGWPPPAAWERSAAESFTVSGGMLRLVLPDAGDGWPRLTRTYQWSGERLLCGAEMSGGTRKAQIIQIIQVPKTALIDVVPQPSKAAPRGYVQLPSTATPHFSAEFAVPPHVMAHGTSLTLKYLARVQKLGFAPQPLPARYQKFVLTLDRAGQSGTIASEPDAGFFTQVYLGGAEPFIELEQLTPAFSPHAPASSTISLQGSAQ